jgi:hypothetical protein
MIEEVFDGEIKINLLLINFNFYKKNFLFFLKKIYGKNSFIEFLLF